MKILISLFIASLLIGCETIGGDFELAGDFKYFAPRKAVALNDPNLTGTFSLYECDPNCVTWNKSTRYTALYLNGTSEVGFYQRFTTITSEKHVNTFLEIFVEAGQHRERLWSKDSEQELQWSALNSYTLSGTTLTINLFLGETYVLELE